MRGAVLHPSLHLGLIQGQSRDLRSPATSGLLSTDVSSQRCVVKKNVGRKKPHRPRPSWPGPPLHSRAAVLCCPRAQECRGGGLVSLAPLSGCWGQGHRVTSLVALGSAHGLSFWGWEATPLTPANLGLRSPGSRFLLCVNQSPDSLGCLFTHPCKGVRRPCAEGLGVGWKEAPRARPALTPAGRRGKSV